MSVEENSQANVDEGITVSSKLYVFIILGFVLILIGVILIFAASAFSAGGSGSFGAVILIGPFPIVFGAGQGFAWLILLGIIIAVLIIVVPLVAKKMMRKDG
jgi:uncharacterized membrane protein